MFYLLTTQGFSSTILLVRIETGASYDNSSWTMNTSDSVLPVLVQHTTKVHRKFTIQKSKSDESKMI